MFDDRQSDHKISLIAAKHYSSSVVLSLRGNGLIKSKIKQTKQSSQLLHKPKKLPTDSFIRKKKDCFVTSIKNFNKVPCLAMTIQRQKKLAFTLAEVLITLAIIGVVASMVVPALLNNTNNKETVTKVVKIASVLENARKMLQSQGIDAFGTSTLNTFNAFTSVLAVSKNCGLSTGCFPSGVMYKYLDGVDFLVFDGAGWGKAILNDGTLIAVNETSNGCTTDRGNGPLDGTVCGDIYVDVNGFTGPNQVGRDVFRFNITKNGIFPLGISDDTNTPIATCASSANDGNGCAAKVLKEKAINY